MINVHWLPTGGFLVALQAFRSGSAPLNSVEGFVRQILGWREYVRGVYWQYMPEYLDRNTLDAMDTNLCMGASIGMAHGMEKALSGAGEKVKSVAVLGDSTFIHSGITGLIDVVYNSGVTTTIILDNGTTAMTGHQEHAGSGYPTTCVTCHHEGTDVKAHAYQNGFNPAVFPNGRQTILDAND